MIASTVMYALKPIISYPSSFEHKNVMYELKNIYEAQHQDGNHSSSENTIFSQIKDQEPLPDLTLLEAIQEKILSQVAELEMQVATLCDVLKQSNHSKSSVETVCKTPVNVDLILNANPKKAPFSILALAKLWSDSCFRVQSHIHSTITDKVPDCFEIRNEENNTLKHIINVRLIWKHVSDLQFNCEFSTCSVTGEVNFLRYLSRLVESHNYEKSDPVETNLTDSILDLCHMLSYQSPKEVQSTISNLNNHLTKGPWFLNRREPSIVDIAAWSLIKQLNTKLSPNLAKWYENCEKTFL